MIYNNDLVKAFVESLSEEMQKKIYDILKEKFEEKSSMCDSWEGPICFNGEFG